MRNRTILNLALFFVVPLVSLDSSSRAQTSNTSDPNNLQDVEQLITDLNNSDWVIRAKALYTLGDFESFSPLRTRSKLTVLSSSSVNLSLINLLAKENQSLRSRGSFPDSVDNKYIGEAYGSYYYPQLIHAVASLEDTTTIELLIELLDIFYSRIVAEYLAEMGDAVIPPLLAKMNDKRRVNALATLDVVMKSGDIRNEFVRDMVKKKLFQIIQERKSGSLLAVKNLGAFGGDASVEEYLRDIAINDPVKLYRDVAEQQLQIIELKNK